MKKIFQFSLVVIASALMFSVSNASNINGTLSTGISTGIEGIVITPPSASPAPGTYDSMQNVKLTAVGATNVKNTTDGSVPTCATGVPYVLPIPVSASLTIKAISCYPNGISSSVSIFSYVISSSTPNPTPNPTPVPNNGSSGGGSSVSFLNPQILGITTSKGDTNNDGKVDLLDFNALMINWGKTGTGIPGDFDGNGVVDLFDFNILMINWTG